MSTKLNWSREQQQLYLLHLKEDLGGNYWSQIAKRLNSRFSNKRRNGKQCRERFINFLQLDEARQESKEWSNTEIKILFENFYREGTKWSEISKMLSYKSENCVKNKFYCVVRKLLRNINFALTNRRSSEKKLVKLQSILRILNFQPSECQAPQQMRSQIDGLKKEIITMLEGSENDFPEQELLDIAEKVRKFNWQYRYYLMKISQRKTLIPANDKRGFGKQKNTKNCEEGNLKDKKQIKSTQGIALEEESRNEKKQKQSREQTNRCQEHEQENEILLLGDDEIQRKVEEYHQNLRESLLECDKVLDSILF